MNSFLICLIIDKVCSTPTGVKKLLFHHYFTIVMILVSWYIQPRRKTLSFKYSRKMLSRSSSCGREDGLTVQLSLLLDSGVTRGDGTGDGEVTMGTVLHLLVISSHTCNTNWFQSDFITWFYNHHQNKRCRIRVEIYSLSLRFCVYASRTDCCKLRITFIVKK